MEERGGGGGGEMKILKSGAKKRGEAGTHL